MIWKMLEHRDGRIAQTQEHQQQEIEQVNKQIRQLTDKIMAVNVPEVYQQCEEKINELKRKKLGLECAQSEQPKLINTENIKTGLEWFANPEYARRSAPDLDRERLLRLRFNEPLIVNPNENDFLNRPIKSFYLWFQKNKQQNFR